MDRNKKINDTYGHEQGDVFIKTFASLLTRILTENSFLARYGGDEFVIIEEHTSLDIVCEGVETKEVADFLTVAGCNEMQGFYYYKPMPSEGFSELLDCMQ